MSLVDQRLDHGAPDRRSAKHELAHLIDSRDRVTRAGALHRHQVGNALATQSNRAAIARPNSPQQLLANVAENQAG